MQGRVPFRSLVRLLSCAGFLCVAWLLLTSGEASAAEKPVPLEKLQGLVAPNVSDVSAPRASAGAPSDTPRTVLPPRLTEALAPVVHPATATVRSATSEAMGLVEQVTGATAVLDRPGKATTTVVRTTVETVTGVAETGTMAPDPLRPLEPLLSGAPVRAEADRPVVPAPEAPVARGSVRTSKPTTTQSLAAQGYSRPWMAQLGELSRGGAMGPASEAGQVRAGSHGGTGQSAAPGEVGPLPPLPLPAPQDHPAPAATSSLAGHDLAARTSTWQPAPFGIDGTPDEREFPLAPPPSLSPDNFPD